MAWCNGSIGRAVYVAPVLSLVVVSLAKRWQQWQWQLPLLLLPLFRPLLLPLLLLLLLLSLLLLLLLALTLLLAPLLFRCRKAAAAVQ